MPPTSAMNRGIGMEGLACVFAGFMGIGTGVTSFSENIGAIGVTRVRYFSNVVIVVCKLRKLLKGIFDRSEAEKSSSAELLLWSF